MNSNTKSPPSMMPVSGRIPEELYLWLSTSHLENAVTMSDKLRVAIATLKRLQDGDTDYNGALEMHRDLTQGVRQQLSRLEPENGHSEVLATILEHAPAIAATLTSAQLDNVSDAKRLEDQLVQRCFQMVESLLRQAVTRQARAYDGQVVRKHAPALAELAAIIGQTSPSHKEGN